MEHVFLASEVRRVILDPGALFSFPAASEHVFVLMIIRSVLMLGRRTLGATTPQASLSRRFILRVALCLGWKQIVALSNAFEKGPLDDTLPGERERNRFADLTRYPAPLPSYTPFPHPARTGRSIHESFNYIVSQFQRYLPSLLPRPSTL